MNFKDFSHDLLIQELLKDGLSKKTLFKAQIDLINNTWLKYSSNEITNDNKILFLI